MARTNAISILSGASTAATLSELYGLVVDNVQKRMLSSRLKSQAYTGDPAAGSVEFKRFANATAKAYGTARTAGKGDKLTAPPVTVALDQHKEIVEEIAQFDLDTFGVTDIMSRRAANHTQVMQSTLDKAFFAEAVTGGTAFTPATGVTAIEDIVESMIQTLESTSNSYVDGVERDTMDLVLAPAKYGELRKYLDKLADSQANSAAEEIRLFHGVRTHSGIHLPANTNAILMVNGAIAQPVVTHEYSNPEKIPLSNDYGVSLFFDYGTKTLAGELVLKWVTTTTPSQGG